MFPSIEPIADVWRELAATADAAPFLWPGWTAAWLDAFGADGLTIFTVWRRKRLVALMPALLGTSTVTSPTNDQTPLFGPLATDADAAARLMSAIVESRPARLELGHLNAQMPPTAQSIAALRRSGYRPLTRQTLRAPFTDVSGDWATFATRIGKKRRGDLRRSERRLREQGDLRVEVYEGGDGLDVRLAEGFRVEAAGWKGEQATAIGSTHTMRGFYTEVAHWAARRGWLHLVFLRLNERAIAFEFILRHNQVLYDLKGGYDEEYRKWGPGIWLMHHIIRQSFTDDTRCIEWLGTDDPYKLEWSDGVREHVTSTWLPPTLRGTAEYHSRILWRASRSRSKNIMRERLPEPVIERMKAVKAGVAGLRTQR